MPKKANGSGSGAVSYVVVGFSILSVVVHLQSKGSSSRLTVFFVGFGMGHDVSSDASW